MVCTRVTVEGVSSGRPSYYDFGPVQCFHYMGCVSDVLAFSFADRNYSRRNIHEDVRIERLTVLMVRMVFVSLMSAF